MKHSPPMTDSGLVEIRQWLHTGYCNPVWREIVVRLLRELMRCRKLIAILSRRRKHK